MAQWWERSPPTNVARVYIPASTPYVGWVCCWFSPLLREVFVHPRRPRGSQSGREKRRDESFHYGRKSPWVPTLTGPFPKIQADAGSWLGTKNALYYCAQSANSFSWVLFLSSYTTAIVLPHRSGSFTKLVRARETFIFYFPNQNRRNYRWVEKTFGVLSAWAIQFAPRIFCLWLITKYRK